MSQQGGLHQSNPWLCPPVRLLLCAWVFDVSGGWQGAGLREYAGKAAE